MTTPILKIKVLPKATVKGKMDVRFPANVAADKFLTITKQNGTYTFDVDYTKLELGTISDPTTAMVALLDETDGFYKLVNLAALITSGLDADLQTIAALTGTGFLQRTGVNSWALSSSTVVLADTDRQNILLTRIYQAKAYGGYRRHVSSFADGYATTDGATVTNGSTDVVTRKIAPTISADTYTTAATGTLTNDAIGQGGVTQRQAIASTSLANISGNKIRVTFTPPSSGNTTLSNVYVGHAGTAPNFDGNQVRLTFNGGNNNVTLFGGGPAVVSDAVTFTYDFTKALIVSMDITGTSSARNNSAASADFTLYFKTGDSANVGATTVVGYSTAATTTRVVSKVEILTAAGAAQNMTVVTTAQTADASSSSGRVLICYQPIDSVTLNTDLTIEVSCNGGTNWASAALSAIGLGQDGTLVAETVDQSATAGTSIQARIKTLNNKNLYLHGASLSWH